MKAIALCVGINKYQHLPSATLYGCVNDALDWAAYFRSKYTLIRPPITLLDGAATLNAVRFQLDLIGNLARMGKIDTILFSWSGHGSQIDSVSEADGKNEVFLCADTSYARWAESVLIDDVLGWWVDRQIGSAALHAYLDTCHSGTGFRDIGDAPRYFPPPENAPKLRCQYKSVRLAGTNKYLWSACADNQSSFDSRYNGRPNGAFSFTWLATRREFPRMENAMLLATVCDRIARQHLPQTPELEIR